MAQLVKDPRAMWETWVVRVGTSPEGKGYPLQYSGQENSMDYSPRGRKESDITERLSLHFLHLIMGGGGKHLNFFNQRSTKINLPQNVYTQRHPHTDGKVT